jgi:predicted DNA-binding protein (UPF0251 family)
LLLNSDLEKLTQEEIEKMSAREKVVKALAESRCLIISPKGVEKV